MNNNQPKKPAHKAEHSGKKKQVTSRHIIRSIREQSDARRTRAETLADKTSSAVGTIWFLAANLLWFLFWILLNVRIIPGIEPFDPFPFGFLTMVVSLEAIILSIFVLISQNRAERIDELRAETDLQIDLITEEELTKLMQMVSLLLEKQGVDTTKDAQLQAMLAPINVESLEKMLEDQIVHPSQAADYSSPVT